VTKQDLSDKCIWYELECKKAKLPYHDKCNGYNMPQCFAYLSPKMQDERLKEFDDKQKMKNGDYQI
jgi:hypothetical protein